MKMFSVFDLLGNKGYINVDLIKMVTPGFGGEKELLDACLIEFIGVGKMGVNVSSIEFVKKVKNYVTFVSLGNGRYFNPAYIVYVTIKVGEVFAAVEFADGSKMQTDETIEEIVRRINDSKK